LILKPEFAKPLYHFSAEIRALVIAAERRKQNATSLQVFHVAVNRCAVLPATNCFRPIRSSRRSMEVCRVPRRSATERPRADGFQRWRHRDRARHGWHQPSAARKHCAGNVEQHRWPHVQFQRTEPDLRPFWKPDYDCNCTANFTLSANLNSIVGVATFNFYRCSVSQCPGPLQAGPV